MDLRKFNIQVNFKLKFCCCVTVHCGGLHVDVAGTGGQAARSVSVHRATGTGETEADAGHPERL